MQQLHFLRRQFEIENLEIAFRVFRPGGFRDRRDAILLYQPAKRNLSRVLAVFLAKLLDILILHDLAPRDGRIGCQEHVM